VQEGDLVHKGDLLARVRTADYVAKVNQAKSQVAIAEAGLEQARNGQKAAQAGRDKAQFDFDRANNLYRTASLTKTDFDGAKAAFDAAQATLQGVQAQVEGARAQVDGARALLDEAELALADAGVRAPMDALVVKKLVEIGSLVGPGSPGFVLADVTRLSVLFGVPDTVLPQLPLGAELTLHADAMGPEPFQATVIRVSPAADPKSRAFDVELSVLKPDRRLKLGMIASVHLPSARRASVPVVPLTAIVPSTTNGRYALFVVTRQGEIDVCQLRDVQLGGAVGNGIAVLDGVKAGERVIVVGAPLVRSGDPVSVVP
jgi:RND family efflux transporter MFP subunit